MPTTIELPIRTSSGFNRAAIGRGASGFPVTETALIIWAVTLLLVGAAANCSTQPALAEAFRTLVVF